MTASASPGIDLLDQPALIGLAERKFPVSRLAAWGPISNFWNVACTAIAGRDRPRAIDGNLACVEFEALFLEALECPGERPAVHGRPDGCCRGTIQHAECRAIAAEHSLNLACFRTRARH